MQIISPGKAGKELTNGINRLIAQLTDTAVPVPAARIQEIIDSGCSHLMVAVDHGVVAGMLTLAVYILPTGTRAVIEDVVVDAMARGKGIGRALLHHALVRAEALGAGTVNLTSHPSREAANRLYRKMGLEIRQTNVYRYTVKGKTG